MPKICHWGYFPVTGNGRYSEYTDTPTRGYVIAGADSMIFPSIIAYDVLAISKQDGAADGIFVGNATTRCRFAART